MQPRDEWPEFSRNAADDDSLGAIGKGGGGILGGLRGVGCHRGLEGMAGEAGTRRAAVFKMQEFEDVRRRAREGGGGGGAQGEPGGEDGDTTERGGDWYCEEGEGGGGAEEAICAALSCVTLAGHVTFEV
jgi:hypothetical protein